MKSLPNIEYERGDKPYVLAIMDADDPENVLSSIDREGRYAYGNQPTIVGWNLARLAEALLPLFDAEQEKTVGLAHEANEQYPERYDSYWLSGMRAKLGITVGETGQTAGIQGHLTSVDAGQQSCCNPRNHLVEASLEAAVQREYYSVMERL